MWEGGGSTWTSRERRIWEEDRREAGCHTEIAVVFLKMSVEEKKEKIHCPSVLCSFLEFIRECCQWVFCDLNSHSVTVTITALDLESVLCTQSCLTLCKPMDCSLPGSSVHGDITGRNTGVGCHFLLRGSSQSRDRTQVSCIAGRFYTAESPISCSRVSDNRSCINSFFTGSVVDHLNVKCHLQLPHPVSPPIFYSFPFFLSSSLVSAP